MCCATVSKFDTNSQTHTIYYWLFKVAAQIYHKEYVSVSEGHLLVTVHILKQIIYESNDFASSSTRLHSQQNYTAHITRLPPRATATLSSGISKWRQHQVTIWFGLPKTTGFPRPENQLIWEQVGTQHRHSGGWLPAPAASGLTSC